MKGKVSAPKELAHSKKIRGQARMQPSAPGSGVRFGAGPGRDAPLTWNSASPVMSSTRMQPMLHMSHG
jgi:hypothetical protein